MLLTLRGSAAFFAPFEEVCEHLAFALHADLATADKVIIVCNETVNVFSHLERKHTNIRLIMVYYSCLIRQQSIKRSLIFASLRKIVPLSSLHTKYRKAATLLSINTGCREKTSILKVVYIFISVCYSSLYSLLL